LYLDFNSSKLVLPSIFGPVLSGSTFEVHRWVLAIIVVLRIKDLLLGSLA